MTTRLELGAERPGLRLGFTLIELLVVITIIGIILAFLLIAAEDARRRAEEDATQALITKLEGGVNDRLDALLQTRPDPNRGAFLPRRHLPRDADPLDCPPLRPVPPHTGPGDRLVRLHQERAARRLRRPEHNRARYPLNFAANPTCGNAVPRLDRPAAWAIHVAPRQLGGRLILGHPDYGAGNFSNTVGTGIYGASYSAAAGIYKNLGYLPTGYDGDRQRRQRA